MRGETKMAKLAAAASPVPLELAGVAEREAEPDGDKTWHVTPPTDKEHGRQLWKEFLEDRFIKGGDEDFDYASVDSDQGLDALERQDKQDSWFDDQEPGWASGGDGDIRGETGVQDF